MVKSNTTLSENPSIHCQATHNHENFHLQQDQCLWILWASMHLSRALLNTDKNICILLKIKTHTHIYYSLTENFPIGLVMPHTPPSPKSHSKNSNMRHEF